MRIHPLAMMAILTAALSFGCGSAREVRSSGNHSNAWGCDQCHGYPPPPFFPRDAQDAFHPSVGSAPQTCTICHPGTVQPDGHSIVSNGEHRNGTVDSVPYKSVACSSCHGLPPSTGRHVFHVTGSPRLTCGACHAGYDPTAHTVDETGGAYAVHMNGVPDVKLPNGYVVQAADNEDGSWPTSECNDCHSHLTD